MNVVVILLDGGQFQVQNLRKQTLGKDIFKSACKEVGLVDEVEYFGLRSVNKKDGEFEWIDNERTLKSQIAKDANDNLNCYLHFAVKFFPFNPTNIKSDLTRYQFVLQLRESLLNGRLECSMPIAALLGSFIAQAEFGDADSPDITERYLDDFEICPDQSVELKKKIRDYHQSHKGMNPEQAELNFLDNIRKLPMYGVHRHLALDVNSEKVYIGVSNIGLTVYRENQLMSTFVWPQILSIGFKTRKFYIKIKPVDEDDDFSKTSVGFKLASRVAAKRLWKICVEHHTFFRLENINVNDDKRSLMKFGSRFSYRGKTECEIMKEQVTMNVQPFNRVSSKRFSERVLKGNRKQTHDSTDNDVTSKITASVPATEVLSEAAFSSVDGNETAPKIMPVQLPEIKVVQASPIMTKKNEETDAVETRDTENSDSENSDSENTETEEQGVSEVVRREDMFVISNSSVDSELKASASATGSIGISEDNKSTSNEVNRNTDIETKESPSVNETTYTAET